MKIRACLSLAAALLVLGGAASAQFHIDTFVDENGNGRLTNTNGFNQPLPFALLPDPGPGGAAAVCTYDLLNPPGLTAGDVLLQDGVGGPVLDVIRFNPTPGVPAGGSLVFYSDNLGGSDALCDTPAPPGALYTNVVTIPEVTNPDGSDGAVYTPTAGQPGFVAGAGGAVTYHITSDTTSDVPEPGTLALLTGMLAPGAVCFYRRRRLS